MYGAGRIQKESTILYIPILRIPCSSTVELLGPYIIQLEELEVIRVVDMPAK